MKEVEAAHDGEPCGIHDAWNSAAGALGLDS